MAAAGLLSSWASPADSLPSAIIFSRCTSFFDDSRTRSVMRATSRLPTSGIRFSISAKCRWSTLAIRLSAIVTPSPLNVSIRENGSRPLISPSRTVPNSVRVPLVREKIWKPPSITANMASAFAPCSNGRTPSANVRSSETEASQSSASSS